jgi:hypothetical protein
MTLYEIDKRIIDLIDDETGEIIDSNLNTFDELMMEKNNKIENVALWIKNLRADAEAYKAEAQAFVDRKKAAERKIESLTRLLEITLRGRKFKTERVQIGYRKSDSVQIDKDAKLPDEYLRFREPEPDKAALKKALKDGVEIKGARLEEKLNMQVK